MFQRRTTLLFIPGLLTRLGCGLNNNWSLNILLWSLFLPVLASGFFNLIWGIWFCLVSGEAKLGKYHCVLSNHHPLCQQVLKGSTELVHRTLSAESKDRGIKHLVTKCSSCSCLGMTSSWSKLKCSPLALGSISPDTWCWHYPTPLRLISDLAWQRQDCIKPAGSSLQDPGQPRRGK